MRRMTDQLSFGVYAFPRVASVSTPVDVASPTRDDVGWFR
jgi:hypothetical protein